MCLILAMTVPPVLSDGLDGQEDNVVPRAPHAAISAEHAAVMAPSPPRGDDLTFCWRVSQGRQPRRGSEMTADGDAQPRTGAAPALNVISPHPAMVTPARCTEVAG